MQRAALRPVYPLSPPTKRRRRTATSVLAGDFDPRPRRDFFTDMANSNDPLNPYNSVLGRGPGILFDVREKHSRGARDPPKIVKRKERDLGERRASGPDGIKSKKDVRRAVSSVEVVQVNSAPPAQNLLETGGSSLIYHHGTSGTVPSLERGVAVRPSSRVPISLPHPQEASHEPWSPEYRVPPLPWAPPVLEISTGPPPPAPFLNSPRTALLPNSPPTPSRSISSYTSRTSSKRLRTPDDDEMMPGPSHMRLATDADSPDAFRMYDASGAIYSPNTLAEPFTIREKDLPPKSPAWYSPASDSRRSELPHGMPPAPQWDAAPFHFDRPPAHRRHALSVAALLSPSVPPPPAISAPPPESPAGGDGGQITGSPVTAVSTVISPYLSQLADMRVSEGSEHMEVSPPSGGAADVLPHDGEPSGAFRKPESVEGTPLELAQGFDSRIQDGSALPPAPPAPESTISPNLINTLEPTPEREESLLPEPYPRAGGRASKAMLIIESEDEDEGTPVASRSRSFVLDSARARSCSTSMVAPLDPTSSVSPAPSRAPRKRPAARKGWKGWIEVEVDDVPAPVDTIEIPLSLRERRTRSGRHFDA